MDELLKIKGIGKATAEKIVAAGFATAAALAAANPEAPIEGVKPEDWQKWIAAAKDVPASEAGPVCIGRVQFLRKTYEIGENLPGDLTEEQLAELKAIKVID